MKFLETSLRGCYIVEVTPHIDSRGWFTRTFCDDEFKKIGFEDSWVQHNHSFTSKKGTIRGMHFQKMPAGETKLIRCSAGSVFDVAVDLRPDSPTYLQWHGEILSSENRKMILIPKGFAHGFQTLTDNVELIYCHSEHYQPNLEAGLNYLDPKLEIRWPLEISEISERDKEHPLINSNFEGIKKI